MMEKETEITTALQSVLRKMPERGLITTNDLIRALVMTIVLLLDSTSLYAQHQQTNRWQLATAIVSD